MIRKPAVAGQFYPADKSSLLKELETMIPECPDKIDAIGIISPHAGYIYSGSVAGEVYGRIKPKSTYVVLGPNHTGYGAPFASCRDSWRTPLGVVEADIDLLDAIMSKTSLVTEDLTAHVFEHSIEVQLPFIQKISQDAKIVPITLQHGDIPELNEVAEAISSAVKKTGKDTVIVASSDMTHYESREIADKKDKKAIQKVLDLDAKGLLEVVRKDRISMCGYIPAAIMLICADKLNAKKAELIKYSDSGETTGDTLQVVGYAGIVVW